MDLPVSAKSVPSRTRISVIIPTRNEARNLPHVLGQLPSGLHEVILVDGRSVDDTVAVARACRPGIRVIQQTRNGKGNAMACGFRAATGNIIVMLDADGSADPQEIPRFVAALEEGADFAKGTRFTRGGASHDITRLRRAGNLALNLLVNRMFRVRFTDLCYGYNAFWSRLVPALQLPAQDIPGCPPGEMVWGDGFEIETLLNLRVAAMGAIIAEVGSVEGARIHGVSNLNAFTDGLRVLRTVLTEWQLRRRLPPPVPAPKEHTATVIDLTLAEAEPVRETTS